MVGTASPWRESGGTYQASIREGSIVGVAHDHRVRPHSVTAEALEVAVPRLPHHAHLFSDKDKHNDNNNNNREYKTVSAREMKRNVT